MGHSQKSGNNGWVVVLAVLGGIFLAGRILPAISRILSLLLGFGILVLIAIIVLVIYFTCRAGDKKSEMSQKYKDGETQRLNWEDAYDPKEGTNYRRPGGVNNGSAPGTNYGGHMGGHTGRQQAPQSPSTAKKNTPPTQSGKEQTAPKAIPACELSPEAMKILNKGRDHLAELRRLLHRIKNLNVKKRGEDICVASERILGALQQQPEDIPMVRQFFNYYLPALGNILLKYLRLEEAGMDTDQTTVKVMSCLGEIKEAMEKQYTAIFANDILDLTVEMEALTQACKRDGLLVSEDFTIREGDREINLTL